MLDLDAPWQLHPSVAVRPEEFGALLYDFRTRRLSFLTSRTLLAAVRGLDGVRSVRQVCDELVPEPERRAVERGLASLVESGMLTPVAAEVAV
ncbi:MAG: mycofactocin biosynthesis protein MftB [Frankiaceae bacterium]|nr:mycofactocin biosynthesis protein MftB [Frankiaceae bacterium]MDQ1636540.1 mycofactocin biosynthesis protein MftB [Frankiaceae bacterium]MDQ1672439.1 mycofactocin biosynthesis protein MftB [Frankiaceae bacterium]